MRHILPSTSALLVVATVLSGGHVGAQQPAEGPALQGRKPGLQVVEPDEQARELRMTPVVRAVQKAADSVVSIYLNHQIGLASRRPVTEGQGSGVILDDSGFVITNWHVVAAALNNTQFSIAVRLKDGRTIGAVALSSSPAHDLALLQLQLRAGETVKAVDIGRSADLMIGESVIAIGNPQGHANTVTSGVLSATGRSIKVQAPDGMFREYSGLLQTDAAINQGNSGGALLDITGKLIGINNAMAMGAENIGFAIPVDTMREVFENELLNSSSLTAADTWLGMDVAPVDGRLVVRSVIAGGPAARAGISEGDQLTATGNRELRSRIDWARTLLAARPDETLPLRLVRDGRAFDVATQPVPRETGLILGYTGLVVEVVRYDVDRELAETVTRAFYDGSGLRRLSLFPEVLRVREVLEGSPAAAMRVQQGDVLLASVLQDQFGRERDFRIDSASGFTQLLGRFQGSTLKLVVLREGRDLVGTLDVRRLGGEATAR